MILYFTGPSKVTLPDFWQMIWEHKIKNVFMVTNLTEDNQVCVKCIDAKIMYFYPFSNLN